MSETIWIEISKDNIRHNIATIKNLIGEKTILAPCVKSNAYGHGLVKMGRFLVDNGADWLSVHSIWEAGKLRLVGIKEPIQVIGYVDQEDLNKVLELDIKLFVSEIDSIEKLNRIGKEKNQKASIILKVDTGMSRQGIAPEKLDEYVNKIKELENIKLEGVATHFANSDRPEEPEYFNQQLEAFKKIREKLTGEDLIFQCANSGAVLLHPESHMDLVRPGKAIYGQYPSESSKKICQEKNIIILPDLTLKTKISLVKEIPQGASVGYGRTFITKRPTKIATIPIGYYDGIDRKLSNRGQALVGGQKVPIIGNVCMNVTILDVTDVPNVKIEDEVVLIGKQGENEIKVEDITHIIDTIDYEVLARLREGITRNYI